MSNKPLVGFPSAVFAEARRVNAGLKDGSVPANWLLRFGKLTAGMHKLPFLVKWVEKKQGVIVNRQSDPLGTKTLRVLTGQQVLPAHEEEVVEAKPEFKIPELPLTEHSGVERKINGRKTLQKLGRVMGEEDMGEKRSKQKAFVNSATKNQSVSRQLLEKALGSQKRTSDPSLLEPDLVEKTRSRLPALDLPKKQIRRFKSSTSTKDFPKLLRSVFNRSLYVGGGRYKQAADVISSRQQTTPDAVLALNPVAKHTMLSELAVGRRFTGSVISQVNSQEVQSRTNAVHSDLEAADHPHQSNGILNVGDSAPNSNDLFNTDVQLPDWKANEMPGFLSVDEKKASSKMLPLVPNIDQGEQHQTFELPGPGLKQEDDLSTLADKMKLILEEEARRHGIGI